MPVLTYYCRNCGSALRFNATSQDWTCEFCGSVYVKSDLEEKSEDDQVKEQQMEQETEEEKIYVSASEDAEFNADIKTYSCKGCGAEIITDETTAATFCFYCHSPAILPQQLSGVYKPSKIIPFTYPKKEVVDRFLKWCKTKPLLPTSFSSHYQIEKLTGIYIPYWLYDCDVNGKMDATARNVRTWSVGDTRYTETKTYDVFREIKASFGGVPADGSIKADDKLMETIEPYDFDEIRPFSMSYLSGFQAEKYDVDSKSAFTRVKERVKKYTNTILRNSITGYNSVSEKGSTVIFNNVKVEYALLPVWMLTYHYNGKSFFFVMNGQTSKIAGKLPLCRNKMARYFLGISAGLYLILVVGGMFI
ncbi:hypothetical protein [Candidatus Contubernalis alkaliaceticus]|uniref:hypothetical protein n=1 Tax=Candidatus Contubernalis alkaliaceticus TaxID=338645 RepID=UPI001F4C4EE2|nr:hypothetical protein [Candidatus Contubernalis alkalaceticus]UNC91055.1 hypothetical protein HUE98_02515 [Candidatus Contubernalis alkalaceticus]